MLYFCMLVTNNTLLNILLPNDNKVLKEVYGPMQKHEYEKKRVELKVSQDLVLKED